MNVALAHPELAPLLIAAVLVVALCVVALVRRRRALSAFAGPGARLATASPARQMTKLVLVGGACVLVVLALIGPQIGDVPRRGAVSSVDTVIALDVSQSMAVRDLEPDRLHAAQDAIEIIGQQLAGARVGLTLFAGSSVVRYPLTADTKILGPALDTSGHGFHLSPGSSLRAALIGAAAQFPITDTSNERAKAIVIVSDGEDPAAELPPLDTYLARNIHIFTLGIGTSAGGPVPVYDAKGLFQQMLVDQNGTQVTSRLNDQRLQRLAADGGGRYFRYDGEASAKSLTDALRAIDTTAAPIEGGVSPEDRYQIFLALAVLLLIADWLIDERRPMPRPRVPRRGAARVGACSAPSARSFFSSSPAARPTRSPTRWTQRTSFLRDPAGAVTRYRDLQTRPNAPRYRSISATRSPRSARTTRRSSNTAVESTARRGPPARSASTTGRHRCSGSDGSSTPARPTSRRCASTRTTGTRSSISRVVDQILGLLGKQSPDATPQPGQQRTPQPGSSRRPGGSLAAATPNGSGVPSPSSSPGAVGSTGAVQPESVPHRAQQLPARSHRRRGAPASGCAPRRAARVAGAARGYRRASRR